MAHEDRPQSARPWWLSLLMIGVGSATFVWLSVEDNGWWVIAFGVAITLLAAMYGVLRLRRVGRNLPLHRWPLAAGLGAVAGAGATLTTAGLMFLKTSLHNHVFPDFPLAVILGTLERIPAWSAAGALIGVGYVIIANRPTNSE